LVLFTWLLGLGGFLCFLLGICFTVGLFSNAKSILFMDATLRLCLWENLALDNPHYPMIATHNTAYLPTYLPTSIAYVFQSMNSSGRSSAMANVLTEFLPLYDTMNELKAKYAEDEFGSKYTGLTMKNTFSKMGVSEYTVAVGESMDNYRMTVVESEYSTEHKKNTVLKPIAMGLELEGNVIRPAEIVASLGELVEEDEEEASAEEEEKAEEESKE
jgi:GrpE